MTLKEQIHNDLIESQKEAEVLVTSVLRMLQASFHNKEIDKRSRLVKDKNLNIGGFKDQELDKLAELDEKEIQDVLRSEVKKRREAIEMYAKGNRPDLVAKETKELKILGKYLPPSASEQEIEKAVKEAVHSLAAKGKQDFGRVMKEVMQKFEGRAEGGAGTARRRRP
jgi:uncharacterized protein YqeY